MNAAKIDSQCDALLAAGGDSTIVELMRANMKHEAALVDSGLVSEKEAHEMTLAGMERLKGRRAIEALKRMKV